jgi:hypothetical protein
VLTKFWEGVGSKLAERWVATVLTPAFAFWVGGLAAWVWKNDRYDLKGLLQRQLKSESETVQWVLVILGLIAVVGSAAIVQTFDRAALRLLEGYWWRVANPLRNRLVQWKSFRARRDDRRFQELAKKGVESLSRVEYEEYVRRDLRSSQMPTDPRLHMPTRLGNILRSAETTPRARYGLDVIVCWPRMWLVLESSAKEELAQSSAQLETAVRWWVWSALFLVWTFWAWWAAPIGVAFALLSYRAAISAAVTYADLLQGVFDIHRFSLYEAVRWPLPSNPSEDIETGRAVTKYLWRGSDQASPTFVGAKKDVAPVRKRSWIQSLLGSRRR